MSTNHRSPLGLSGFVLAVRFLTELALLAGLAVVGARVGGGVLLSVVFAVLLPLAAAALWGAFIAPRATRRLAEPGRLVVELVLFAGTGLALVLVGWPVLGGVVAVAGAAFAVLTRRYAEGG